jgi:hypothetical protein
VYYFITVDDEDIHRIAQILASDTTAIEKKSQIYGGIGLPLAELMDLKQRLNLERSNSYDFFVETLNKFKGRNGSQTDLMKCFKELELLNVVGELEKKLY